MKTDELIFDDGSVYKGEVNKKGLAHGKGTYTFKDGSEYVGEFKNDEYHGKGSFTFFSGFVHIADCRHIFVSEAFFVVENPDMVVGDMKLQKWGHSIIIPIIVGVLDKLKHKMCVFAVQVLR